MFTCVHFLRRLVLLCLGVILLVTLSSFTAVVVNSLDVPAVQMLRFFRDVDRHATWNSTNDLADWLCGTRRCCTFSTSNSRWYCVFSNIKGKLSNSAATSFNDPAGFPLQQLYIDCRWGTGAGRLSGTVDFSKLGNVHDELRIMGVKLAGSAFSLGAGFSPTLRILDLNRDSIGGGSTVDFSEMPASLQELNIQYNNMKGAIDLSIPALSSSSLRRLYLRNNDFTGEIVLSDIPSQLTHLGLEDNRKLTGDFTDMAFPVDVNKTSKLRVFRIGPAAGITCATGGCKWQNIPDSLQYLTVRYTNVGGDISPSQFAGKSLLQLDVRSNKLTSGAGVWDMTALRAALPDLSDLLCSDNPSLRGPADFSAVCAGFTRWQCYNANFSGNFKFCNPEDVATSPLGQFYLTRNPEVTGVLDWAAVPWNMSHLSVYSNNFTSTINDHALVNLKKLYDVNIHYNRHMTGNIDFSNLRSNSLRVLRASDTLITSPNAGNITLFGPAISHLNFARTRVTGDLDLSSSKTIREAYYYDAQLDGDLLPPGLCGSPASDLVTLNIGDNHLLHGKPPQCNLTTLMPKLRELSLYRTNIEGNLLLYLPNVTTLRLNGIGRSSNHEGTGRGFTNDFLDLTHLPLWLDSFTMHNNGLSGRVVVYEENVPYKYRNLRDGYFTFCDLILRGNRGIQHMPLCNITMTPSRSISRPTPTATHSETLTATASRTVLDWCAEWMLVVLGGVSNIPAQWSGYLPLSHWRCDPPFGDGGLCCAFNTTGDGVFDSCAFRGLHGGPIRLEFTNPRMPKCRGIKSISITDSSPDVCTIYTNHMPSGLQALSVERVSNVHFSEGSFSSSNNNFLAPLPSSIANVSFCDNTGPISDLSLDFAGTPSSIKSLRLCGFNTRRNTSNMSNSSSVAVPDLSKLPRGLQVLELPRNNLGDTFPWSTTTPLSDLRHLDLSENLFDNASIDAQLLPPSLQLLNVSHNGFVRVSLADFPPSLATFDGRYNRISSIFAGASQQGPVFDFSPLREGIVTFLLSHNKLTGSLRSPDMVLPSTLRTFCITHNALGGIFEMTATGLGDYFQNRTAEFCRCITAGNNIYKSVTCGITVSTSLSKSRNSVTLSGSPSPSQSLSRMSQSESDGNFTDSRELSTSESPSRASISHSLEATNSSNETSSRALSPSRSNESSPSRSVEPTATATIQIFPPPFRRDAALTATLIAGAVAAALTPTASAAALIVSRQTAVARSMGGKDGFCGGPTEEDPFAFFEDPLRLRFGGEGSCSGMLVGIAVGNVLVVFAIFAAVWIFHAAIDFLSGGFCPTWKEGLRSGWPLEFVSVFGYGFLLPPAATALFTGSVRCPDSADWLGSLGAVLVLVAGYYLFSWYYRRTRCEVFIPVRAQIPLRLSGFGVVEFVVWLVNPSGVWRWRSMHGGEQMEKEFIAEREVKMDDDDEDEGGIKSSWNNNNKLQQQSSSVGDSPASSPSSNDGGDDEEDDDNEQQQQRLDDERTQWLLFESVSRLLDKYTKKSWWFLMFEVAVRAFMSIGPAVAEAIDDKKYSCLALRAWYLIAINILMVAVIGRRPYLHRALFFATVVATVAEITVLVIMIVSDGAAEESFSNILLLIAQVVANVLAISVEVWMYIGDTLRKCWGTWAFLPIDAGSNKEQQGGQEEEEEEEEELPNLAAMEEQLVAAQRQQQFGDADSELDLLSPPPPAAVVSGTAPAVAVTSPAFDADDTDDFARLDRRLRRAYAELHGEEVEVLPAHEKYQAVHADFDEYADEFAGI